MAWNIDQGFFVLFCFALWLADLGLGLVLFSLIDSKVQKDITLFQTILQ